MCNHKPLLTAAGDVAHDVSGNPQFLHVAWSQRAPHSGLLGVAAAEKAPHDRRHRSERGDAPRCFGKPKNLEQGGSGAQGCWLGGQGRRGQQEQEEEVVAKTVADREHFPPRRCPRESAEPTATSRLVTVGRGCLEVLEGACLDPTDPEGRTGRRSQGGWSRIDLKGGAAGRRSPWRRVASCILGRGHRPGGEAMRRKAGPGHQGGSRPPGTGSSLQGRGQYPR